MATYDNWIKKRFLECAKQTYTLRNIFILPTFYTLFMGVMLIILWVMSVQFLINLGYLLVFLLFGLIVFSMMKTYRTLDGLSITNSDFLPVFAGEIAGLGFELYNQSQNPKGQIDLVLEGKTVSTDTISAHEYQSLVIPYQTTMRGIVSIPRITIRTVMPVGFFVAWSYYLSAKKLMVFPKPIFTYLPMSSDSKGEDKGRHEVPGREEIIGLREYQLGDSLNLISWKHLAQREIMVSKVTVQATGGKTLQFFWNQTEKSADDEYRLSQLCGWIVSAHQNGDSFGIVLPNCTIAVDSGAAHLRRCLEALASY